jgi:hypothetical protein
LDESRSGLEENAARTAAQVERQEILHCLSEQGNPRLPRMSLKNFSETGNLDCLSRVRHFLHSLISSVHFWIQPKMLTSS